jgi:hypothetical protein
MKINTIADIVTWHRGETRRHSKIDRLTGRFTAEKKFGTGSS